MITISAEHSLARLAGTKAFIEAGAGVAIVALYSIARVADGVDAGAPMATMPLANPCGAIIEGGLALTAAGDGIVNSTGEALWCRIFNRDGVLVASLDVRALEDPPEAGEVVVEQRTMFAGGIARLVSAVLE